MFRRFLAVFLSICLCCTTVACSSYTTGTQANQPSVSNRASAPSRIPPAGEYPVQQVTYDDATGEYSLMLLNTPAGTPPVYRSLNLQMARLTDEEISSGKKTYLKVADNQPELYLTEDFKIAYVHNVTETQTNPQTGQPQTVVVRQESNFWSPFAGAVAGQVVGNLLFRPHYYVPPVYSSGSVLRGYGGYGTTYADAVGQYQTRYNTEPPAVRNRQAFRTTGNLRPRSSSSFGSSTTTRRPSTSGTQSSGSGFGSSTLRSSGKSSPSTVRRPSSFGSGSRSPSRSFSRRR